MSDIFVVMQCLEMLGNKNVSLDDKIKISRGLRGLSIRSEECEECEECDDNECEECEEYDEDGSVTESSYSDETADEVESEVDGSKANGVNHVNLDDSSQDEEE